MIATVLAAAARLVSGASVQWRCDPGCERQRVYFANHSSHLDFLVIWSALPPKLRERARPVAGRDYWAAGASRRYLARHVFHAVLVDRGHVAPAHVVAQAQATIRRMADEMGGRDSLIVFPEGTRSASGTVERFKSGLYHLSRVRPDVELVPVHLENLNRILPRGEVVPVPVLSRVVFGPPLGYRTDEEKDAFLARARAAVIRLKEDA